MDDMITTKKWANRITEIHRISIEFSFVFYSVLFSLKLKAIILLWMNNWTTFLFCESRHALVDACVAII